MRIESQFWQAATGSPLSPGEFEALASGQKRVLGLDLGSDSIKAAALKLKKNAQGLFAASEISELQAMPAAIAYTKAGAIAGAAAFEAEGADRLYLKWKKLPSPFNLNENMGGGRDRARIMKDMIRCAAAHFCAELKCAPGDLILVVGLPSDREWREHAGAWCDLVQAASGAWKVYAVDEAVAAVLYARQVSRKPIGGEVLVIDAGAHLLKASYFNQKKKLRREFSIELGGNRVDEALVKLCAADMHTLHAAKADFCTYGKDRRGLVDAARMRAAMEEETFALQVPCGTETDSWKGHLNRCLRYLHDVWLRGEGISHIVITGGAANMPLIRENMKAFIDQVWGNNSMQLHHCSSAIEISSAAAIAKGLLLPLEKACRMIGGLPALREELKEAIKEDAVFRVAFRAEIERSIPQLLCRHTCEIAEGWKLRKKTSIGVLKQQMAHRLQTREWKKDREVCVRSCAAAAFSAMLDGAGGVYDVLAQKSIPDIFRCGARSDFDCDALRDQLTRQLELLDCALEIEDGIIGSMDGLGGAVKISMAARLAVMMIRMSSDVSGFISPEMPLEKKDQADVYALLKAVYYEDSRASRKKRAKYKMDPFSGLDAALERLLDAHAFGIPELLNGEMQRHARRSLFAEMTDGEAI